MFIWKLEFDYVELDQTKCEKHISDFENEIENIFSVPLQFMSFEAFPGLIKLVNLRELINISYKQLEQIRTASQRNTPPKNFHALSRNWIINSDTWNVLWSDRLFVIIFSATNVF